MKKILLTGSAGFIGFHLAESLLKQGVAVYSVDNINDYYDINLKNARLDILQKYENFYFFKKDIADKDIINFFKDYQFDFIINLAAQPGVRYSIENPHSYINSNLVGFLNILEIARNQKQLIKFIYASSSSVYGNNKSIPFSESDIVKKPSSLYAATKISNEAIAYSYASLYKINMVGLRFFTVYGPYSRPDMATYLFTNAIYNNQPINLFNNGCLKRDFTYIDDIINGIEACFDYKMEQDEDDVCHEVFNLGNNNPVIIKDFVKILEDLIGKKAQINSKEMQLGDMYETCADIANAKNRLGYEPKTDIKTGLSNFVKWYIEYNENKLFQKIS